MAPPPPLTPDSQPDLPPCVEPENGDSCSFDIAGFGLNERAEPMPGHVKETMFPVYSLNVL